VGGVTKVPAAPTTSAAVQTPAPLLTLGELFNDEFHGCLSAVKALDGTHLAIAACDGSMVQHWQALLDGTIRSAGLCMDVANASTADFTPLQVAVCSGNSAQKFLINQDKHVVSLYANKCINVHSAAGAGTSIVIFPCVNQPNQFWRFQQQ
jgi:hypothetical protein